MNLRIRLSSAAALIATCSTLVTASPASAAGIFRLGFNDDQLAKYSGWLGTPPDEVALNAGIANGRRAGASEWRFMVRWEQVARAAKAAPKPATLSGNPAWGGYVWDDVDRMVRTITANGMAPLPWIARAPTWAEGPNRPPVSADVPAGTWRPSAMLLQEFAKAFAIRYSGTYPDPTQPGRTLPRVSTFQGWNEPNLYTEITPQWVRSNGKWKIESVGLYRQLLNAFYRGVKSAQPTATVVGAGTGPFGDLYDGERRIQPARFYRELLCVKAGRDGLKGNARCPKLRFDGWAHHTYPIGPPTRTARNADDVVVPDMSKLTKIVAAAQRAKTVSRKAAANVWMTEMSWESAPDPNGLSLEEHALYLQGALYVLWKAGVQHVLWWNVRDNEKGVDWNSTHQSGVYSRGATPTQDAPKPAFTAYRFPFAAYRTKGVASLWSKPPTLNGAVTVQAFKAGNWATVATLRPGRGGTMTGRLRVGPGVTLRATQGTEISLPWRTF